MTEWNSVWMEVDNTETGRRLVVIKNTDSSYAVSTSPFREVEIVKERLVGKRIRAFMKEKNGKQGRN